MQMKMVGILFLSLLGAYGCQPKEMLSNVINNNKMLSAAVNVLLVNETKVEKLKDISSFSEDIHLVVDTIWFL